MRIRLPWSMGLLLFFSFSLHAQFDCDMVEQPFTLKSYQANMISNTCPSHYDKCNGKIVWENGSNYEGEIHNSIMQGRGKLIFQNEYEYEGEFQNDLPHGSGKIIFENGAEYDGEWKFGKKEGFGAFIFPCGNEYLGNFKNDKMHGEGVVRISKTESFLGFWENGLVEGKGIHTRSDASQFIGEYKNGEKNGKGMVTWNTGDTLRGTWKNGMMENESQFKFADGSKIIQFWKNGLLEDRMIFIQEKGLMFSATAETLNQLVINSSLAQTESTESNFSLAYYAAALEYRSLQNFEGATQQLEYAQFFQAPFEDSKIAEWVDFEMESISAEKEKLGVARKEEDKEEH